MSSEPEILDPLGPKADEELARMLVVLNRLSQESVERINAVMKAERLRFDQAALQSGAVSQAELDEAREWINRRALGKSGGLIEEMLRRTARKRDVILWEHDQLEPSSELILPHQPDHPYSEGMRSLRTELLLRCKGTRGIITLLSPCPGDGRSRLAAELAIAFAQLERRTLLVDADLRTPSLHRLFGTENDMGLAQALTTGGASPLPRNQTSTGNGAPYLRGGAAESARAALGTRFRACHEGMAPKLRVRDSRYAARNALFGRGRHRGGHWQRARSRTCGSDEIQGSEGGWS